MSSFPFATIRPVSLSSLAFLSLGQVFPGLLGKVISGILLGSTPCLLHVPGDLIIHYPLNAHCLEVGIIRSLGTTLMTGGSTVT